MQEYEDRKMRKNRMRVLSDGSILFKDPDESVIPVLKAIDPGFRVESVPPPASFTPNLTLLRRFSLNGIKAEKLKDMGTDELWFVHEKGMKHFYSVKDKGLSMANGQASLLDLKIEIAARELQNCGLCGTECRIDRFKKRGKCGLMDKAYYSQPFTHICEEAVINAAINLPLYGCSWRCIYCQASELIEEEPLSSQELTNETWNSIVLKGAVSFEFAGGNPTESLYGILSFLSHAPETFNLPIVWNDNLYGSVWAYGLLNGIVDLYLPDMRYGNDDCATAYSGVHNYWETATSALNIMMKHDARIIVRLLVLPGHVECCHTKALDYLAGFKNRVWISILDQYVPEYKAVGHVQMGRTPTEQEVAAVKDYAVKLGFRDVNDNPGQFWN